MAGAQVAAGGNEPGTLRVYTVQHGGRADAPVRPWPMAKERNKERSGRLVLIPTGLTGAIGCDWVREEVGGVSVHTLSNWYRLQLSGRRWERGRSARPTSPVGTDSYTSDKPAKVFCMARGLSFLHQRERMVDHSASATIRRHRRMRDTVSSPGWRMLIGPEDDSQRPNHVSGQARCVQHCSSLGSGSQRLGGNGGLSIPGSHTLYFRAVSERKNETGLVLQRASLIAAREGAELGEDLTGRPLQPAANSHQLPPTDHLPPRPHKFFRASPPISSAFSSCRRLAMPSESNTTPLDPHPQDQLQAQIKVCSACHCPLSTDSANTPFLVQDHQDPNDTSIVCGPCRTRLLSIRADTPVPTARENFIFAEVERTLLRHAASLQDGGNEASERHLVADISVRAPEDDPCLDAEMDDLAPSSLQSTSTQSLSAAFESHNLLCRTAPSSPAAPPQTPCLSVRTHLPPLAASMKPEPSSSSPLVQPRQPHSPASTTSVASTSRYRPLDYPVASPDPLVDISRLRVRSQGHHCLYPGATFQGTQRSGRNSYDVNVTIVVSFARLLPVIS